MKDKKSSFHMGNEFNGSGEKVYLRATEYKTYEPLSQKNVRLTPDFKSCLQRMLGSVLVIINPTKTNNLLALKVVGGIASVEQVVIKRDDKKEGYFTEFELRKIQLTNGSYLHKKKDQRK